MLLLVCFLSCGEETIPNGLRKQGHEEKRLQEPESLEGRWQLHLVNDTVFNMTSVYGFEAAQPFVEFVPKENRIGGFSGCNDFGGTAYIEAGTIRIPSPPEATQIGCGENVWERDFFDRLMAITSYERSGQNLKILQSEGRSMLFVRKVRHPLEGKKWILQRVNGKEFDMRSYGNDPQPVISFDLEKGSVGGWNGCNNFGLEINYANDSYTSGTLFSDARGCYPGWLEVFDGVLGDNERVELGDDTLLLTGRNGNTLQFRKE